MTAHGPAAEPPEPPVDPFAGTPYEGSPEGWWTPYGGALDQASGVVHIPQGARRHEPPGRPPFPARRGRRFGWAAFVSAVLLCCFGVIALVLAGHR
ncbi:hypothetical protein [Streptomyces celluloflavus]|uniref:hypothetical protein n=1 Tax=Streptomyces celluloflavus TaxID=58344 RepID=UPI003460F2F1|nr:hypothetical protein OG717_00675 [Streptomyces celluloflavus]WSK17175.1 hypothetical protein OG717_38800 [Streptomyces celluloflavus]